MDADYFMPESLKPKTLQKLSRRIEAGVGRAFPVFIDGRWTTHLDRPGRRNLQIPLLAALLLAAPASALVNHWENRTVSLTGPEAVLLYKNLNTPEVVSNGGFRQPSRMKAAFFGPFMVVCDTHAAPVCSVTWPEPAVNHLEASVEEMGGVPPCLTLVEAKGLEASFRCSPEGIAVSRTLAQHGHPGGKKSKGGQ